MHIRTTPAYLWTIGFWIAAGLFWSCSPAVAADQEAARVIAATPGVFVERQGQRSALHLKDAVFKEDTITTDATGKAQILFNDDTTLAVAPDSVVNIADFSFGGSAKASFGLRMSRGMTRIVTGRIVEQNRDGFKVTTPHATVGIRGTIFSPRVTSKETTVVVTQIGGGHFVSVTNIGTGQVAQIHRAGMTAIAGPQGNTVRPATPQELTQAQTATRRTSVSTASRRAAPNATSQTMAAKQAAGPNSASTMAASAGVGDPTGGRGTSGMGGASEVQTSTAATQPVQVATATLPVVAPETPGTAKPTPPVVAPGNPGTSDPTPPVVTPENPGTTNPTPPDVMPDIPDMPEPSLPGDSTGDGSTVLPDPDIPTGPGGSGGSTTDPGALNASYSGTLGGGGGWKGNFSFDMNMGSLKINNGSMSVGHQDIQFSAAGGKGSLDRGSNNFHISDFTHVQGLSATQANIHGQMTNGDTSVLINEWNFKNGDNGLAAQGHEGSGTRK